MKRCSRCHSDSLEIIRESTVRRGRHQYALYWYSCPQCREVNFSYRHLPALGEIAELPEERTAPEQPLILSR